MNGIDAALIMVGTLGIFIVYSNGYATFEDTVVFYLAAITVAAMMTALGED